MRLISICEGRSTAGAPIQSVPDARGDLWSGVVLGDMVLPLGDPAPEIAGGSLLSAHPAWVDRRLSLVEAKASRGSLLVVIDRESLKTPPKEGLIRVVEGEGEDPSKPLPCVLLRRRQERGRPDFARHYHQEVGGGETEEAVFVLHPSRVLMIRDWNPLLRAGDQEPPLLAVSLDHRARLSVLPWRVFEALRNAKATPIPDPEPLFVADPRPAVAAKRAEEALARKRAGLSPAKKALASELDAMAQRGLLLRELEAVSHRIVSSARSLGLLPPEPKGKKREKQSAAAEVVRRHVADKEKEQSDLIVLRSLHEERLLDGRDASSLSKSERAKLRAAAKKAAIRDATAGH